MFSKNLKMKIKIDSMRCSHCASKVASALKNIDGVKKVSVDLNKKQVTIISNKEIEENIIKETVEDLDYVYLGIVEN